MKKDGYNVAVVGATGAVGNMMINVLERRSFPVKQLLMLASGRFFWANGAIQRKRLSCPGID